MRLTMRLFVIRVVYFGLLLFDCLIEPCCFGFVFSFDLLSLGFVFTFVYRLATILLLMCKRVVLLWLIGMDVLILFWNLVLMGLLILVC